MDSQALIPHLFRTEYSKIVAVLCRRFGMENVALAEDIASETFATALYTWPYKGIPENPPAWLYTVAKNKAKNYLGREAAFRDKVSEQLLLTADETLWPDMNQVDAEIEDNQLQMMFAICHPTLPPEAQSGLALRLLCGFGIDEIANAFLISKETVNKRLFRAREKLRNENISLDFPEPHELPARLDSVLATLYLLFSEGYYSESDDTIIREDLCEDAMRLTFLLTKNASTARPEVYALLALMSFHASRFAARISGNGDVVLYDDQDESLWDQELITKGAELLAKSATGTRLTRYHLEATIAYWHTQKSGSFEKWKNILELYDTLLEITYSPVAALNRIYALAKVKGKAVGIRAAEQLDLDGNPYYYTLLSELYRNVNQEKSRAFLKKALSYARTQKDRNTILRKMHT